MVLNKTYQNGRPYPVNETRPQNIEKNNSKTNHEVRWCAFQAPYPEAAVESPNMYYARLLMEDHAGVVSELSAVTQYLYHDQILNKKYPDVADLLECISIVEMHHMHLLGEAITQLGGKPKYGTRQNAGIDWWKGDYVYYGFEICDMLAADIQGERDAIAQYRRHIEMIEDNNIRTLIERIIQDEQEHIVLLTEKFQKYCRNQR